MKSMFLAVSIAVIATACSGSDNSATSPPISIAAVEEVGTTPEADSASETIVKDTPTSTATPETTTAPTTTVADAPIEQLLGDSVRAYFDTRLDANGLPGPDPDDPRFADVATGTELEKLETNAANRLAEGQALRAGANGLSEVRVGFVEVDGDAASVSACSIDDEVIFDVTTGDVVNDEVVTHNYVIDLTRHEGVWKIAKIVRVQQWEGVSGCALANGDYPF